MKRHETNSDNNIDIDIDIDNHNIKVECDHVITVRLTPIDGMPFEWQSSFGDFKWKRPISRREWYF